MSAEDVLESPEGVEDFLNRDDRIDLLYEISKPQLVWVADYLHIETPSALKKALLVQKIKEVIEKEGVSDVHAQAELLEKQMRMKELELEERKLNFEFEKVRLHEERELERLRQQEREREREEREREREEREREREHELHVLRMRKENGPVEGFNVSSAIKLVPIFNENDVAEFFSAFEKVARKLGWPQEMWTTLLQCRLVGKAQKVYITLSEEVSADYEQVKNIILRAYELVPEAYRQRFRNLRKNVTQTFVEFARLKEQMFDEWCRSRKVDEFSK